MTIDEFLDREYQMGNVLQGGGASTSAEVERENEQKRAEGEDDTLKGYLNEESKLADKRAWDEWTDDNKRGSGNRIGRS
jgi:immunoglobulin-binding protein 1